MGKGQTSGLLFDVLDRMERENIQYCLLRDYDQIEMVAEGGEVDLLVREEQLPRLAALLAQSGFARLPGFGYAPHHFFVAYNAQSGGWLKLDVVTRLSFGRPVPVSQTDLAAACLARRRKQDRVYIPAPEDELVALLLHCLLDKGQFKPERQQRITRLASQTLDERYLDALLESYWAPGARWTKLLDLINGKKWDQVLKLRQAVYQHLNRGSLLLATARKVLGRAQRAITRLATSGRPQMLMAALLAPDGAGKSTLTSGLSKTFYFPVKTTYMGLYPKRKVDRLLTRLPGLGFAWRIAGQWAGYLNGRLNLMRRRLVIFDRYGYDALASESGGWIKRARRWALAHACPDPDLVFVLDAPAETLFSRKQEHDVQFLDRQRQFYHSLSARLPQARVIDVTQPKEEVCKQVIQHIWQGIVNLQNGKKAHETPRHRPAETIAGATGRGPRVGYIVSRFPKLTETFVLYEMLAVEMCGVQVELYPLIREREPVVHPEAKLFLERAHFQKTVSWPVAKANFYYLLRKPGLYLHTLAAALKSTWGNPRMFRGTVGLFPKAAFFAHKMAEDGIEHIHAHFARHPATAAFIIHRLSGIPYSFTAHGSDIHVDRRMLPEKVAEAQFVVPISEYNRRVIVDECKGQYAEKMRIIHVGVDTNQVFQPRSWNGHAAIQEPVTIVCIGTLHEVKGQVYLIESCKQLKENGYHFTCHFLGDGPDRHMLVRAAEAAGVSEQVVFHGQVARPDVIAMLQKTDILVTPSVPTSDGRREGIPTVLMEAMASGVPVVASDLSGIPELVDHGVNGFLVPPRDVNGLAEAIGQLIRQPELRKQLGQAGRLKVESEFDLQRNAARLAEQFSMEVA